MKRISIMDSLYQVGLNEAPPPAARQPARAFCDNTTCGSQTFAVMGAGRMRWVESAGRQDQMCPVCGRALYWSAKWRDPQTKTKDPQTPDPQPEVLP